MGTRTVQDVMTGTVVVARPGTLYKEVVDILARYQVSALPVVDDGGRVVGVVSTADLLHRLEFPPDHPHARLFERRRQRAAREKASADTAAELMTSPAVTIRPAATVGDAARAMERAKVKRLPVVDDNGVLVGIVSRGDLLRTYLRADPDIRRDVLNDVLWRMVIDDPGRVEVLVAEGVVTLTGGVDRRTTAQILVRLVRAVDGVVDVVDHLAYDYDDIPETRRHYLFDAQVPPTVRWP